MNVDSGYKAVRGDVLRGPDRRNWIVNQVVDTREGPAVSIIAPPLDRFPGQCVMCHVSTLWGWEVIDKAIERPKRGTIIRP